MHSFFHSFNKYLLRAHNEPNNVLGAGKTDQVQYDKSVNHNSSQLVYAVLSTNSYVHKITLLSSSWQTEDAECRLGWGRKLNKREDADCVF